VLGHWGGGMALLPGQRRALAAHAECGDDPLGTTGGGHLSLETRYYITSLPPEAKRLLPAIRSHWQIENSLHWVLDIAFREDESRLRKGHGQTNLSVLRKLALNLLKQDTCAKGGIKAKRLRAGWDSQYLLSLLNQ